jgi:HEPN domain-containing protein
MKRPDEYAQLLLQKARGDAQVVEDACRSARFEDWVVGFHAQQAVEKALKAVLSSKEVAYPHTHSLKRLLQLLADAKLPLPQHHERLPELSQFAGNIRYGARRGFTPAESIDRAWALACVERTLEWAARMIEPDP